jgi:hypothetical protein
MKGVCLLDQAGKLLERVVAARLESHLPRRTPGLHDSQFGFRKGRPTADAIAPVRSPIEGAVRRGCVALAVSPDVVNAFNSISWDRICQALEFHRMPCGVWSGPSFGTLVSSISGGAEGLWEGRCAVVSRKILYWARCCGTSHMTRYFGLRCTQTRS